VRIVIQQCLWTTCCHKNVIQGQSATCTVCAVIPFFNHSLVTRDRPFKIGRQHILYILIPFIGSCGSEELEPEQKAIQQYKLEYFLN
jgi:hypothetical protein